MEKQKVSNVGMKNTIHSDKQYFGLNQIENSSEHIIAELRARKLHRAQVGRQGQQPFKFRGKHRAPPSGGVR